VQSAKCFAPALCWYVRKAALVSVMVVVTVAWEQCKVQAGMFLAAAVLVVTQATAATAAPA
jgi:hypothetical protein